MRPLSKDAGGGQETSILILLALNVYVSIIITYNNYIIDIVAVSACIWLFKPKMALTLCSENWLSKIILIVLYVHVQLYL